MLIMIIVMQMFHLQLKKKIVLVIKLMAVIVVLKKIKSKVVAMDMVLKHIKLKEMVKLGKKCNFDISDNGDCEEDKDYSIDCESSYLVLSLLSLILLFL